MEEIPLGQNPKCGGHLATKQTFWVLRFKRSVTLGTIFDPRLLRGSRSTALPFQNAMSLDGNA